MEDNQSFKHNRKCAVIAAFVTGFFVVFLSVPSSCQAEEKHSTQTTTQQPVPGETWSFPNAPNEIRPGTYVLTGNGVIKVILVTEPLCLNCLQGVVVQSLENRIPQEFIDAIRVIRGSACNDDLKFFMTIRAESLNEIKKQKELENRIQRLKDRQAYHDETLENLLKKVKEKR